MTPARLRRIEEIEAADEYDGYDEPDYCDHEDYDADILTGRAMCYRCGHAWYQTSEEIAQQEQLERDYAVWCEQEYRIERLSQHWWGRAWLAVKRRASALLTELRAAIEPKE
jgi:hypothetical protein